MAIKFTLRNSILIPSLSIPLISFIIIIIYVIDFGIDNNYKIKANYSTVLSSNIIDKIERNYYERYGDVQAFAYNPTALAALSDSNQIPKLIDFMNTMTNYYVLYDLMMLVDYEGNVIAVNNKDKMKAELNSTQIFKSRNLSNTKWFQKIKFGSNKDVWYSDFLFDKDIAIINNDNDYGTGVQFVAPVRDKSGATKGFWYNFSSWKEITQKIRKEVSDSLVVIYPNSEIIITNKFNKIIDANNYSHVLKGRIFNLDKTAASNYIISVSAGKGAYTYKGNEWKVFVIIDNKHMYSEVFSSQLVLILTCIVCLILTYAVIYNISQKISSKLISIKDSIVELSRGELTSININGQNEILLMSDAINKLVGGLNDKSVFAEKIGQGELQAQFIPASDSDVLGKSLLRMQNNLSQNAEDEKRRTWANVGIAKLSEILRGENNSEDFYNKVIIFIIKYLGANQGGLFIMELNNLGEKILKLRSCYAYDRKKYLEKEVRIGEGLVGQCYLEREIILLTEIPNSYINITSGMGAANPSCIAIIPLKMSDKVYGILEIASFTNLEKYQIDFLEKISENIASSISTVLRNDETKKLLNETLQQSEDLQSKEEEMRQNLEEMVATQEEMSRKEIQLQLVLKESMEKEEQMKLVSDRYQKELSELKALLELSKLT